jgi:hypothetical protein
VLRAHLMLRADGHLSYGLRETLTPLMHKPTMPVSLSRISARRLRLKFGLESGGLNAQHTLRTVSSSRLSTRRAHHHRQHSNAFLPLWRVRVCLAARRA